MLAAAGGNIGLSATSFQNTGTLEAANGGVLNVPLMPSTIGNIIALSGGTVNIPNTVYFNGLNLLSSQPGGTVKISGNVLGNTKNLGQFTPLDALILNGTGTATSPQLLEVMWQDFGTSQLGFIHNFNYGTLALANNTYVQLINQYQNSSSTGPEELYVNSLVVPAGTKLDLNGFHVYARATQIGGTILHGTVTQIPNSGPIGFSNPTLGNIASAGQLDQWTFFGRAGQLYTVLVDPSSGSGTPPYLGYVEVKVINTNGVVLTTRTNATSGAVVFLSSLAITNDGTYSVQVHVSAASPSSTGHYMVTIWQTTPNVMPLPLGQIVSGTIKAPYSVDQWNFGAVSNSQVRFHLVNISGTGVGFDLSGPNGWTGFTNLTVNSGFVTLPTSGNYSVLAHSLSGQAQLFQFNVPAGAPLQVVLNNLVTGNHGVIYASLGHPPTPSSYDYSATASSGPTQRLLIPLATAGTWYVLIYGDNIQTAGGYTVTASSSSLLLYAVTPNRTGINAPSTLTLTGAGFDSTSSVQFLDASNNVYPATSLSVDSFTQITVTEAAGALPPGVYSIRASLASGGSGTMPNSFQVLANTAPNLVTSVTLPGQIGYHVPATIYPNYANTGDAATPAPLLVLKCSVMPGQLALPLAISKPNSSAKGRKTPFG